MTDLPPDSPKDFEAGLGRLEEIVSILEDGELRLENALELFEEGIRLSRFCHSKLGQAERRVELLLKDSSGELIPFDAGTDSLHEHE